VDQLIHYNLVHDVNVAIECLMMHATVDFDKSDAEKRPLFVEPLRMLEYLTLIYHVLATRYSDEESLAPNYEGEVVFVRRQLSLLSQLSEELLTRHSQKFLKNKSTTA
jgi:hypothetical protein